MRVPAVLALLLSASCAGLAPAERPLPTDWTASPGHERGIAWRSRIGSATYAPPVVADGLIWIGTNNAAHRDPSVTRDAAVLMCFRESDGEFLWQRLSGPRTPLWVRGDWTEVPLRCAPTIENDRLWFVENSWEVVCLDIGPLRRGSGLPRELWKTSFIDRLDTSPMILGMSIGLIGSVTSGPDGLLYLSTGTGNDESADKLVRPNAPALVCLDKATGEVRGVETSGITRRTRSASWSVPVLARAPDSGRALLLFGGGDGFLYAFDPIPVDDPKRPGTRMFREIWKTDCGVAGQDRHGITARPLVDGGRVYAVIGDDFDTFGPGNLVCVDLATGRLLWNKPEFQFSLSTPVIRDGLLFAAELEGYIDCFDATTGERFWQHDTLSMIVGSPLLSGGNLYISTGDEEVLVLNVGSPARRSKPPVIARNDPPLHFPSLAGANGTLLLPTRGWLYAVRSGEPGEPLPSTPTAKRGLAPDAAAVPTPWIVVRAMLNAADTREDDLVYDLGSGDGRIVLAAARDFRARAVGVELDQDLVATSRESLQRAQLGDRARIEHEDLLKADFGKATVITLYIGDRLNRLLLPKLQELPAGVRIVSHHFHLPGIRANQEFKVEDEGREHRVYLYRTPLKP